MTAERAAKRKSRMSAHSRNAITVFGVARSVYTRIVRLALEEKGAAYRLQEVDIFRDVRAAREHLRRHPFGRIPVLQHGDLELYETAAITRYVDEALPGPALQPLGVARRARMNQIISMLDSYAYRPMVWGVFVQRVVQPREGACTDEGALAASLAESASCLDALAKLARPHPFLLGERLSLADIHALPMLSYLSLAPEGERLVRERRELASWLDMMLARPSVLRTRGEYEHGPA